MEAFRSGLYEGVLLQQAMRIGCHDAHRRGAGGWIQHRPNVRKLAMKDLGHGSVQIGPLRRGPSSASHEDWVSRCAPAWCGWLDPTSTQRKKARHERPRAWKRSDRASTKGSFFSKP